MRVDSESLAFVLRRRALCTNCLADNLGASRDDVAQACRNLVIPQRNAAQCDGCLRETTVHRLS